MNELFEMFVLFYMSWHEKECTLTEMRKNLLDELGESNFNLALGQFKEHRLNREAGGDFRTYWQAACQNMRSI